MKAIVYLPIKPEVAKENNLPVKLPVLAEDVPKITQENRIPLDVIIRGLEAQVSLNKDDKEYYSTYLQYFYYEKFKKLIAEKDYDSALEILEKAKTLGEDYRYHFYKGILLREMGNEKEAEIEFKIASSMNPNFSLPHYELGRMYMKNGEYSDAEAEFLKALEKDPDFPLPYVKLGDVYLSRGDIENAVRMYENALRKSKNLPDVYNRLGVIENTFQNFEKAEMMFRKALEIDPDYHDAKYNLAFTLTKLGKLFEALEILLELEKSLPNDPMILNELGIVMRELGLFEESVKRLEKALEFSKDDGIKFNLARSLMFVDRDRARETLSDLLTSDFSEEASRLIEYMDMKRELDLEELGEIGSLSEEISGCNDLKCVLENIEPPEGLRDRIESILEGYIPKGGDIDTVNLLDLGAAYILSAEDFVEMERNAIEFSVAVYGSGIMIAVMRVILRAIQMRLSEGEADPESLIDSAVPEIQDIHWKFSLKLSKSLESIPSENPKKGSDFVPSLLYFLKFGNPSEFYLPWIELLKPKSNDLSPIR